MAKKIPTETGSDGKTYSLYRLTEIATSYMNSPELTYVHRLMDKERYVEEVWFETSFIQRIQAYPDPEAKALLVGFAPPLAGLSQDDFFAWAEPQIQEQKDRHASYRRTSYNARAYSQTVPSFHLTSAGRYSMGWRESLVALRSVEGSYNPYAGYGHRDHSYWQEQVGSLLNDAWKTRRSGPFAIRSFDQAQVMLCLDEYLWGEGKDFIGTLDDYLQAVEAEREGSPDLHARLTAYAFKDNGQIEVFSRYLSSSNVASLSSAKQKRSIELLLEQDRDVWLRLVKEGPSYSKGTTHKNLEEFIEEIHRDLGRGEALDFKLYTPAELRREYTLLVAEGVLFEGPYYNPSRLHGLAAVALKAVPGERVLELYTKEYSHILHLVRTMLEAEKSETELQLILAEDSDQERVREAAKSAGKLTLMQTVGLMMATFHPKAWMRGTSSNGPYLFVDLLESEGLAVLQFISEILFETHPTAPTEMEWRRAMGSVPMNVPAALSLPLMVTSKAMASKTQRSYSDLMEEARACFGIQGRRRRY